MKKSLLWRALCLALAVASASDNANTDADRQAILKLQGQAQRAHLMGDAALLAGRMADKDRHGPERCRPANHAARSPVSFRQILRHRPLFRVEGCDSAANSYLDRREDGMGHISDQSRTDAQQWRASGGVCQFLDRHLLERSFRVAGGRDCVRMRSRLRQAAGSTLTGVPMVPGTS